MIYDSWCPRRDSNSYPQSTNPEHIYLVAMLYMFYCWTRAVESMMMMMLMMT